jgi:hypothetical protein
MELRFTGISGDEIAHELVGKQLFDGTHGQFLLIQNSGANGQAMS